MSSTATAVTVFHRAADVDGFGMWLSGLLESARLADGFVDAEESLRDDLVFDWAVAVSFRTEKLLNAWLDSGARADVIASGESRGFWRSSPDLVIVETRSPPTGVAVFRHNVWAGKNEEFRAAQVRIAIASAEFPGCTGTAVFPPGRAGESMSVVRFRTGPQLMAWMKSTARADALPQVRSLLKRNFSQDPHLAPFGATVRTDDGQTEITPGWKVAMLVLLVVYPTVMVLTRFLGPILADAGIQPWLTLWLSQTVSTVALQWILIPLAWLGFRRWLDPVDGRGTGISLAGAAVMVALYGVTLLVFATVKELQFWDY